MSNKYINGLLLVIAGTSVQAWASEQSPAVGAAEPVPETITFRSTGFAKAAADHVTSVSAKCPGRSHTLRIDREQKRVTLTRDDTDMSSDLSSTTFGATFLTRSLYGKFSFNCPSGIGLTFFGFEARHSGPPKAATYTLVIGEKGEVITDSGLREESYETINRYLAPESR